jgi:hypothetical protein
MAVSAKSEEEMSALAVKRKPIAFNVLKSGLMPSYFSDNET